MCERERERESKRDSDRERDTREIKNGSQDKEVSSELKKKNIWKNGQLYNQIS